MTVYFSLEERSSSHDIRAAFCTGKSALDVNPISVKGTTAGFAANAGLVMTSEVMANIDQRRQWSCWTQSQMQPDGEKANDPAERRCSQITPPS